MPLMMRCEWENSVESEHHRWIGENPVPMPAGCFWYIRKVMSRLKISAISYLNTAPLMWDFEHAEAGANFDISYTIPSACAEALGAGPADIGIIPAAAYTTIPDLVIIPDVAIAARRAVQSILLVSRRPVDAPLYPAR